MGKLGFDNDKYLSMQSEHIRERISLFGGKLYLEFGGKLFDDYHASRVLPGFQPDSKIRMLQQLRDDVEIVIAVCANDIEKNKLRGDLGISYDDDCLRLMDAFRALGLYVGSIVVTQYAGQSAADAFLKRLDTLGVKHYCHYPIAGYPSDVAHIVSDEGFGKNDYIETTHSLVVVTAPGPGSGKMATCLSQLYHEHKHGVAAGYAKFETFPIWNLPLKHPVNLAYEAATADLNDVNMIDPFHLDAYGKTTVNYNRDVEIFPVLRAMFEKIQGKCPYQSPTDMGVNMAGNCIIDDEVCREASRLEILRRYYTAQVSFVRGEADECQLRKLELVMQQAGVTPDICPAVAEGRGDRQARRRDGPARRPRGHRQDELAAGSLRLPAAQRAQGAGRRERQARPHFRAGHRADLKAQDRKPRAPQPAPALGRGSYRAVHLGADEPHRPARAGAARQSARLRRALLRHHLGGGHQALQAARHPCDLRAEVRGQKAVP